MQERQDTSIEFFMQRFQDRLDAEAFEQIFSHFLAPALATAQQILSDPSLAEDAVQETFLRVIRKRRQYLPSRPFSSWFYAILRNVCKDMLRSKTRYTKLLKQAATRSTMPAWQPSPDSPDCLELLAKLPRGERAVLKLKIVHELPFRDIAAALGISQEAAKKRAQRGLRRLRRHITVLQQNQQDSAVHRPAICQQTTPWPDSWEENVPGPGC